MGGAMRRLFRSVAQVPLEAGARRCRIETHGTTCCGFFFTAPVSASALTGAQCRATAPVSASALTEAQCRATAPVSASALTEALFRATRRSRCSWCGFLNCQVPAKRCARRYAGSSDSTSSRLTRTSGTSPGLAAEPLRRPSCLRVWKSNACLHDRWSSPSTMP